mgnify:CR=1 FL=1
MAIASSTNPNEAHLKALKQDGSERNAMACVCLAESIGKRSWAGAQTISPARPQRARPRVVPSGYVEGESDVRTKREDCFSTREKQYGRPCTRWEVARIVALMTPNRLCVIVPAQRTLRPARMREH